jgi:hypothetical protein
MIFREALESYAEEPITRQLIAGLLKDYKRPYDKIHELVKSGELISLKNGLYIPGDKLPVKKPDFVLVANHLWGPSYVSVDTALSFWGLIPEKVYETISFTIKAAKTYRTPIGRFTYIHSGLPYYSFGIRRVQLSAKQAVLIASPEKALCDKIISTAGINLRSLVQTEAYLLEDLRLNETLLKKMDLTLMASWLDQSPKASSLSTLIKTLERL